MREVEHAVAIGGVALGDEAIVDLEAAAVGGVEADHVPGVDPRDGLGGHEEGAGGGARRHRHRGAGPVEHRGREAEPGGVPAAARHLPFPAHAMAALDLVGAGLDRRSPAQRRARLAPDLARRLRLDRAGGGRAAVHLADAPGRAGVELAQRLHGAKPGAEVDLVAVVGARQQHAEQALLVQLVDDLRRELPERLVGRAGFLDDVGNAGDALDRAAGR